MGASREVLVDVYNKQIRSTPEFAAVVWNAGLKKDDITKLKESKKVHLLYFRHPLQFIR